MMNIIISFERLPVGTDLLPRYDEGLFDEFVLRYFREVPRSVVTEHQLTTFKDTLTDDTCLSSFVVHDCSHLDILKCYHCVNLNQR